MEPASSGYRPVGRAAVYGMLSALLYALMYVYEDQILTWTTRGKWYFVLPVIVAFAFSFVHGAFTGYFWQLLGIRPRTTRAQSGKST